MGQCAGLLDPLYLCLKDFVLSSKVVGTDDTPVKVLDRNLPHTRKGRIWPYIGDRDHPGAVYHYTPTRERAGPEEFLKDFRGYLQADAYVAYDSFFTDPERGLVEVGCWAHARRHFKNALEKDPARMGGVLAMIAHLYGVEKTARQSGLRGEDLRLAREHGTRPMLNQLHEYLLVIREQVLPKSEAMQAIAYTLNNWTALTRYCGDGDLSIDNNATERSLRGFAIGRNYVQLRIMCSRPALSPENPSCATLCLLPIRARGTEDSALGRLSIIKASVGIPERGRLADNGSA
jgi:transposase